MTRLNNVQSYLLFCLPEYEYEENEEREEHGHIVHGPEHDDQLISKGGQESD